MNRKMGLRRPRRRRRRKKITPINHVQINWGCVPKWLICSVLRGMCTATISNVQCSICSSPNSQSVSPGSFAISLRMVVICRFLSRNLFHSTDTFDGCWSMPVRWIPITLYYTFDRNAIVASGSLSIARTHTHTRMGMCSRGTVLKLCWTQFRIEFKLTTFFRIQTDRFIAPWKENKFKQNQTNLKASVSSRKQKVHFNWCDFLFSTHCTFFAFFLSLICMVCINYNYNE